MTEPPDLATSVREQIAIWAHLWASAAKQIEEQMTLIPRCEQFSVSSMDALTLAVVDAVHNTYRGACVVLGDEHPDVLAFEKAVPDIKKLRNRLEHFDAYLRGDGFAQKRNKKSPPLEFGVTGGVAIPMSSGGPGGHIITVTVQEIGGEKTYIMAARPTVRAARQLARSVFTAVGFDDQRHAECATCLPDR